MSPPAPDIGAGARGSRARREPSGSIRPAEARHRMAPTDLDFLYASSDAPRTESDPGHDRHPRRFGRGLERRKIGSDCFCTAEIGRMRRPSGSRRITSSSKGSPSESQVSASRTAARATPAHRDRGRKLGGGQTGEHRCRTGGTGNGGAIADRGGSISRSGSPGVISPTRGGPAERRIVGLDPRQGQARLQVGVRDDRSGPMRERSASGRAR